MCDGYERSFLVKMIPKRLLNDRVRLVVYGRCRCRELLRRPSPYIIQRLYTFVQDQQLALTNNGSRQGQDLSLTNRQVLPAFSNHAVQCDLVFHHILLQFSEARSAQCRVEGSVIVLLKWVQILSVKAALDRGTCQTVEVLHLKFPLSSSGCRHA